jgi:hypothetical protein
MKKITITTIILIVCLTVLMNIFAYRDNQASNGDLNHDGHVNALDLSILASHYDGKK